MLWGFCLSVCLLLCLFFLPLQFSSTDLGGNQQIWSMQVRMYIPELPPDLCKGHSISMKLPVRQLMESRGRGCALSPTHPRSQDLLPKSSGLEDAHLSHCTLCCGPSPTWDGCPQQPQAEVHQLYPWGGHSGHVLRARVGIHPLWQRRRVAEMFSSACAFSAASGCWLGASAVPYWAKFVIPQHWKTFCWHCLRHLPFCRYSFSMWVST